MFHRPVALLAVGVFSKLTSGEETLFVEIDTLVVYSYIKPKKSKLFVAFTDSALRSFISCLLAVCRLCVCVWYTYQTSILTDY